MRSLGMTRRQARLTVAIQATTLAIVGLVFGIPLGLAAGRYSWRVLADATPVVYVAPFAALALLIVIPGAVAAANTLAAWPARHAARLRPADVLRAE
jgi:ABC-type antimicrobial peptide transport system permease subunit